MILKESDLSGIEIVDNEVENINNIRKQVLEKADVLIEKSFQTQVNIITFFLKILLLVKIININDK